MNICSRKCRGYRFDI